MNEIFAYPFLLKSISAIIILSITCGIIGTYIVSKRIVFISGAISHASFGGIGIGYFFGFNPILGAIVFSILSSLGIEIIQSKSEIRSDSMIGILWSAGMAIGIIFIYLTPGYAPNLMSYLFGNILMISNNDLIIISIVCLFIIIFFKLLYKEILYIAFDPEFSRTRGLPVNFLNYLLMALISLTIVLTIKMVGIILVISMLTIPQATSGIYTNNFSKTILLSIFFGLLASICGMIISFFVNIPSGATIIFMSVGIFIVLKFVSIINMKLKVAKKMNNSI